MPIPPQPPVRAAARAALLAADRAHAARSARSLTGGFPTALDRDVVVLYPGAPVVRGRAAAESLFRALPGTTPVRAVRWRTVLAAVSADGLRGYTLGVGTAVGGVPTWGDSAAPVRTLAYWRRTPAGAWHVAAWVLARGNARDTPVSVVPAPCADPAPGTPRSGTSDADLRAADSLFSARSAHDGAGPAFTATVAPDGLAVAGAAGMTCAPAAVGALLAGLPPGALTWAPVLADAAPSGDLGMTVGTATVRDGTTVSFSKYLTVWRRTPDGTWRFAADAGNAAPGR